MHLMSFLFACQTARTCSVCLKATLPEACDIGTNMPWKLYIWPRIATVGAGLPHAPLVWQVESHMTPNSVCSPPVMNLAPLSDTCRWYTKLHRLPHLNRTKPTHTYRYVRIHKCLQLEREQSLCELLVIAFRSHQMPSKAFWSRGATFIPTPMLKP